MIVIVPLLVWSLRRIMPTSTASIGGIIHYLEAKDFLSTIPQSTHRYFVTWLGELRNQDFHFQTSLAIISIAATWKRFLPRGSGYWALMTAMLALFALLIDGALRAIYIVGAESPWPLNLKLTGAIAPLEPLVIGTGAAYTWFALRYVTIAIFPTYSSQPLVHDRIK
jgi:hypothetical protein